MGRKLKKYSGNIFYAICLLVAIISTLSSYGQKEGIQDQKLRVKVAAYNVEFSDKGTSREIAEMLKPYDFDIVCFSEAPGGNWTKDVATALGMKHSVVGKYSTAGHKDKYKTIVSKTALLDYEEVLMADTLHSATKAITQIGGKKIAIYSVHFPFGWRDQAHIDETTGKVTSFASQVKAADGDETAIVMGDFNFILSTADYPSMYYDLFVKMGFEASWKDIGTDVTKLSSMVGSSRRDTTGKGRVIDHIMYPKARVKALDGQIIELDKPLSDHKPVWALLEIE